jgi:hypothetical protein
LQGSGGPGPVADYYSWATLMALNATGEEQYYVGVNLQAVWTVGLASADDTPHVQSQAIAAYQAMLDNFPTAVTYDASGTIAMELETPAVQGIIALKGMPANGWVLVNDVNGIPHAEKH